MKITLINVFLYCKVFDAAQFAIWTTLMNILYIVYGWIRREARTNGKLPHNTRLSVVI